MRYSHLKKTSHAYILYSMYIPCAKCAYKQFQYNYNFQDKTQNYLNINK